MDNALWSDMHFSRDAQILFCECAKSRSSKKMTSLSRAQIRVRVNISSTHPLSSLSMPSHNVLHAVTATRYVVGDSSIFPSNSLKYAVTSSCCTSSNSNSIGSLPDASFIVRQSRLNCESRLRSKCVMRIHASFLFVFSLYNDRDAEMRKTWPLGSEASYP